MSLSRIYQLAGLLILMNTNKKNHKNTQTLLLQWYTYRICTRTRFLSGSSYIYKKKKQLTKRKENDDKKK